MSEFMKLLRERTDRETRPIQDVFGPDAPVVKMAEKILAAAEEVEREISMARVRTSDAAERTRWSAETLQKYARMKLAGETLPEEWAGLEVVEDSTGYLFVVGTIPMNARAA